MTDKSIPTSDEAWEEGVLGTDEKFARAADPALVEAADIAGGTQLISVRMQQTMIDDLKAIAAMNGGIGYQTLMKQVVQRFIDSEKKRVWNDLVKEKMEQQVKSAQTPERPRDTPARNPARKSARKAA